MDEAKLILPETVLGISAFKESIKRGKMSSPTRNAGDLKFEEERLKTFKNWTSPVSPKELAASGFFFTGDEDYVKCVFCAVQIRQWVKNDKPGDEHRRISSDCDFVRGRPCGNVIIGAKAPVETFDRGYDPDPNPPITIRPFSAPERPCTKYRTRLSTKANSSSKVSQTSSTLSTLPKETPRQDIELCVVCLDNKRNIVLLPCAHFVCCSNCLESLTKCPVCRKRFDNTLRAILA